MIPAQELTKYRASERVFEAIEHKLPGSMITYAELTAIIGKDARTEGRGAVLTASRKLLREKQRLLLNVKNVGYQVSFPTDHLPHSQSLQRRSRNRLRAAMGVLVNTALDQLTPIEANKVLVEQVRVRLKLGIDQQLDKQAEKLPPKERVKMPTSGDLLRLITRQS